MAKQAYVCWQQAHLLCLLVLTRNQRAPLPVLRQSEARQNCEVAAWNGDAFVAQWKKQPVGLLGSAWCMVHMLMPR